MHTNEQWEALRGRKVAFGTDIEKLGCSFTCDTVQIGWGVVGDRFQLLDSGQASAYYPGDARSERRCMEEFWADKGDVLKKLEEQSPGDCSETGRVKMVQAYVSAVVEWQRRAVVHGFDLVIVTDNGPYDLPNINFLIEKYMPFGTPTFPHNMHTGKYDVVMDTHQLLLGLLGCEEMQPQDYWGLSEKLRRIYDIPEPRGEFVHNHDARQDAISIALEYQHFIAILEGRIGKRDTCAK